VPNSVVISAVIKKVCSPQEGSCEKKMRNPRYASKKFNNDNSGEFMLPLPHFTRITHLNCVKISQSLAYHHSHFFGLDFTSFLHSRDITKLVVHCGLLLCITLHLFQYLFHQSMYHHP